jgi:hypothetical protein
MYHPPDQMKIQSCVFYISTPFLFHIITPWLIEKKKNGTKGK